MYAQQFVGLTNNLSDRQRVAIEMLIAGVAFEQADGKTWDVFSHHGDLLGTMSTFMVSEAACLLRKAGLKSNRSPYYQGPFANPCSIDAKRRLAVVTFYHGNGFPDAEVLEMMERRFKNEVNLH
jgi:hypothetical protein